MRYLQLALCVILFTVLSACARGASQNGIKVEDAWVRAVSVMSTQNQGQMGGSMSAAYMRISNSGDNPDRLLKVSSDAATNVEMHISEMKDGVMTMHPVESIEVPARALVELKPGGLHIMLIGVTRDLAPGEKVKLSLEFEEAGEIQIEAEVRAP